MPGNGNVRLLEKSCYDTSPGSAAFGMCVSINWLLSYNSLIGPMVTLTHCLDMLPNCRMSAAAAVAAV
jgi:hypothetical protein